MIAKLTGILDSIGDDWAVIDVGGVGYLVFCSTRTLAQLPGTGEAVSFVIETHIREDHIHLYGFLDQAEREWFKLLTTVQGVGAKVGLGIQSVLGPRELTDAILAQDKGMITRAPGVGPKVATRLLTELKDKVGGMASVAPRLPRWPPTIQSARRWTMPSRHWSISATAGAMRSAPSAARCAVSAMMRASKT